MNPHWKTQLLAEILPLQKGTREQAINDLSDLFLTSLDDRQRDVVIEAINAIKGEEQITSRFLESQIRTITTALGQPVNQQLHDNILIYVEAVHLSGKVDGFGTVEAAFNPWDTQAQVWNQEDATYWIGKSYTRDVSSADTEELSERLRNAIMPAFTDGADRFQLADILYEEMNAHHGRSKFYYEGLANHIVTRTFGFGLLSGMDDAGIERYKISAVMDDRTTEICKYMDGVVITVASGLDFANTLINTDDPEAVKDLAPWREPEELPDRKKIGNDGSKLPQGMRLPPYHWFCRTSALAVV